MNRPSSPDFFTSGFVIPMLVGTIAAAVSVVIALLISPENKGRMLEAELSIA